MRFARIYRFGLLAILLSLPCWALPPTVTTCALPATSIFRAPVTIAIAVSNDSGLAPAGIVQVSDNGTIVGASGLDVNGTTKITTAFKLGVHVISCSYSGDTMLAPSVSGVSFITTAETPPTIVLTPSQNPVPAGQRVQIDALVAGPSGGAPSGSVTLKDGNSTLAVLPLSLNEDSSVASFIGMLSAGTHNITGSYDGDTVFTPATTAQPLGLLVGKRSTNTIFPTVLPSPAPTRQPAVFQIPVVS